MSKSGNTWFKIKRAKLRKQDHAARRYYDGALSDKAMPCCDGVEVKVIEPGCYVPATGKLSRRFDARTFGNGERKVTKAADYYGLWSDEGNWATVRR